MDSSDQVDVTGLITRIRDGDRLAWTRLTDRYTNLLWSVARGMGLNTADSADAVQTTWLRLVERIDSVRQPEYLGSWLATTMRRECLAALRRGARERVSTLDGWEAVADGGAELDEALLRQERDAALWLAFGKLRLACKRLLRVLMADPAPSYAEVSKALDMPIGSIGPSRRRCLSQLRDIMLAGSGAMTDADYGPMG
jgi:RNA polymerase sigma factor (sigma-70 family)